MRFPFLLLSLYHLSFFLFSTELDFHFCISLRADIDFVRWKDDDNRNNEAHFILYSRKHELFRTRIVGFDELMII